MQDTIGIDISKDQLDAFSLTDQCHKHFANDTVGIKELIIWARKYDDTHIIFEPTGPYHRQLEAALVAANLAAIKVNPLQARRFAEATGTRAKTDRVDAAILARMGAVLELEVRTPKSENLHQLRELYVARLALIKDQTAARNRQKTATQPLLKRQIAARLKQIESQKEQIDKAMKSHISKDANLVWRADILASIPGIGRNTAHAIIVEMPELGTLDNKQVASLAGLAPITRQSGKWRGKDRIQGGRAGLRRAIYMPALVALRHNADLRKTYQTLRSAGKPAKVAITAVMRKLIVLANALLRDRRIWSENRP